jgi:hypothetical protein
MRWLGWLGLGLGGAGCRNACQDICLDMADYATECGFPVSDAEIDACLDEQSKVEEKEDRKACRDFNDPQALRLQWSCDELADYWVGAAAQGTDTPSER